MTSFYLKKSLIIFTYLLVNICVCVEENLQTVLSFHVALKEQIQMSDLSARACA